MYSILVSLTEFSVTVESVTLRFYCIGVGSKFKVGGLDFKTWILTIVCVKIYVKCMHPLLKSGGAEAPPAPLVLRPCCI